MYLKIKFSSRELAEKLSGMALLTKLDLLDPIALDGETVFYAEDAYDECGPGCDDGDYMEMDFIKIKRLDPKAEIACVTNADEGTGLHLVADAKSGDDDVSVFYSANRKMMRSFASPEWFALCDSEKENFDEEDW